jgi:hypothetical protein
MIIKQKGGCDGFFGLYHLHRIAFSLSAIYMGEASTEKISIIRIPTTER